MATITLVGVMVFVAPPMEEVFFRGVLQRYVSTVSSPAIGIGVGTVLFVPMHVFGVVSSTNSVVAALVVVAVLAILSVVLGLVYTRTDNLLVPITVHASYNALSVALGMVFVAF